jgi:hypothetical protein
VKFFLLDVFSFADDGLSPERSPNKSPFGDVKTYSTKSTLQQDIKLVIIK